MTASAKYRKRPIEVEAIQWTGGNAKDVLAFTDCAFHPIDPADSLDDPEVTGDLYVAANSIHLGVETGEWIIKDARGFYPCKADVFARTYEAVA